MKSGRRWETPRERRQKKRSNGMKGRQNKHPDGALLRRCCVVYKEWNKMHLMKLFCEYYFM